MRTRIVFGLLVLFGAAPRAEAQPGQGPVVFLHGLCSSSDTWAETSAVLQSRGWKFGGAPADPLDQVELARYPANADFYLVNFTDQIIHNGVESWAADLRLYLRRLDQYRVQRGVPSAKFTVVAHSAGGLAADYYLKSAYEGNVSHLITYGTPHMGTDVASFRLLADYTSTFLWQFYRPESDCANPYLWEESVGVQEMVSGSKFLTDLNDKPFPAGVQYTSLIGQLGLGSVCPSSDCIVPASSQDMGKLLDPPQKAWFAALTAPKSHIEETSDSASVLWALTRLASAPSAPHSLTAVAGASTVSLGWSPPASGPVSSYFVEAGSVSGLSNLMSFDTGFAGTEYFVGLVVPGPYFFRVRGRNQAGIGPPSNEVSFTIAGTVASTPSRFVGTWINLDPIAYLNGGITTVSVRSQGNSFFENIWSACGFSQCADGEVPASVSPSGSLVATKNFSGLTQTDTFSLTSSGFLSVIVHFHFVDGSSPDSEITATLIKQ